jgi:hypothetical protein
MYALRMHAPSEYVKLVTIVQGSNLVMPNKLTQELTQAQAADGKQLRSCAADQLSACKGCAQHIDRLTDGLTGQDSAGSCGLSDSR